MKNKSTLTFLSFLVLYSFSLIVNAQKLKTNSEFEINIVKFSDKPNFENTHTHLLELKNNSRYKSEYVVSVVNTNSSEKNHNESKHIENRLVISKESNITTEIYKKDSNSKLEKKAIISLEPNESIMLNLKIQKKVNATLGSWNCSTISVLKLSKSQSKSNQSNNSKSITVKTFVPNPNNRGH